MALYEKYKVDPRNIVPLYTELCERDERLTLSEVKILGLEATLLVSNAIEGETEPTHPEKVVARYRKGWKLVMYSEQSRGSLVLGKGQ